MFAKNFAPVCIGESLACCMCVIPVPRTGPYLHLPAWHHCDLHWLCSLHPLSKSVFTHIPSGDSSGRHVFVLHWSLNMHLPLIGISAHQPFAQLLIVLFEGQQRDSGSLPLSFQSPAAPLLHWLHFHHGTEAKFGFFSWHTLSAVSSGSQLPVLHCALNKHWLPIGSSVHHAFAQLFVHFWVGQHRSSGWSPLSFQSAAVPLMQAAPPLFHDETAPVGSFD